MVKRVQPWEDNLIEALGSLVMPSHFEYFVHPYDSLIEVCSVVLSSIDEENGAQR